MVLLVAPKPPGSMSRHGFPCVVTWFSVLSYRECRNMAFLCCNRFGLGWRFLGHDIHFYVVIGVGHYQGSLCHDIKKK